MKPDPRISIYCACGCQWHGRYAIENPVIPVHDARGGNCRLISAQEFVRLGHPLRYPKRLTKVVTE